MSIPHFTKHGFREKSKEELEKEEHFFHQLYRVFVFLVMTISLTFLFIVL